MSDDLREAVARALLDLGLFVAIGTDPDDGAVGLSIDEARKAADAALTAARPQIERETREACAKVARAAFDDRPRSRDNYHYQDGYDDGTKAAEAAIRSQS